MASLGEICAVYHAEVYLLEILAVNTFEIKFEWVHYNAKIKMILVWLPEHSGMESMADILTRGGANRSPVAKT